MNTCFHWPSCANRAPIMVYLLKMNSGRVLRTRGHAVGTLLALFCRVLRMRMGRERLLECLFDKPGGTPGAFPYAELLGPKPRPRPEDQFVIGEVPNAE